MTFLAPGRLWLLAVPLLFLGGYLYAQRLRHRHAVRFSNVELLASIAPRRPGWRRHVPAAGLLAALALLAIGVARPAREVRVPRERATIILALDVSLSMAAEDVRPNRLAAAQRAAREFVRELPQPLEVGLVTFARSASLLVAPTTDRDAVIRSIDSLTLAPSTAIGEAVFTALDAIAAADAAADGAGPGLPGRGMPEPGVRAETHAHVVLMSDGKTTVGRSNEDAAAAAREAGVPVTTIAYGTDTGTITTEGRLVPVPVDRPSLRSLAEATEGTFFEAADGDELSGVYEDIGRTVGYDTEQREVTVWFTGLALALASLAAAGSLVWMSRLP